MSAVFTIDIRVSGKVEVVVGALAAVLGNDVDGSAGVQAWRVGDAEGREWEVEGSEEGDALVLSPDLEEGDEAVLGDIVRALRRAGVRIQSVKIGLQGPEGDERLAALAVRIQAAFA